MNSLLKISKSLSKIISIPNCHSSRSYHEGKPIFSGTFYKLFPDKDREVFMDTLPKIINELTVEGTHKKIPLVNDHMAKSIEYNTPWHGFGMHLPYSYRMLMDYTGQLTQENYDLAQIMGWCVEFSFCFFIMMDDIMDKNVRRRARPVWHSDSDVGLLAMNDAVLLESGVYELLHNHFGDKSYYLPALREFQTTIQNVAFGQSLDGLMPRLRLPDGKVDLDSFSLQVNKMICFLKSGLILYSLPGTGALIMAGHHDKPKLIQKAKEIYYDMGWYVQAQNDFMDYFRDQQKAEEDGTDILTGKCSWPIGMAVQVANPKQMKVLKENYGFDDRRKISNVYQVYEDLNMPGLFAKWEDDFFHQICDMEKEILKEEKDLPPNFFTELLEPRICGEYLPKKATVKQ